VDTFVHGHVHENKNAQRSSAAAKSVASIDFHPLKEQCIVPRPMINHLRYCWDNRNRNRDRYRDRREMMKSISIPMAISIPKKGNPNKRIHWTRILRVSEFRPLNGKNQEQHL